MTQIHAMLRKSPFGPEDVETPYMINEGCEVNALKTAANGRARLIYIHDSV